MLVQAVGALWCNGQTVLLAEPNQQPVDLTPQIPGEGKRGGATYVVGGLEEEPREGGRGVQREEGGGVHKD